MFIGIICGPTGVGKSEIACKIALANGYEIISADSRQIFKGLEIGTGVVSPEWQKKVPHHFIGTLPPGQTYSVHQYYYDVFAFERKHPHKKFLVVGGTPLYIKSLIRGSDLQRPPVPESIRLQVQNIIQNKSNSEIHGYLKKVDPRVALKINVKDVFRMTKALENFLFTGQSYLEFDFSKKISPPFADVPLICLIRERKELYENINKRVVSMFLKGWIKEVEALMQNSNNFEMPALNALGYKDIAAFILGKYPEADEKDLIEMIQRKTRNYAKKQLTFYKGQLPELQHTPFQNMYNVLHTNKWNWETLNL